MRALLGAQRLSRAWRPKASRRRAWSSATPTIRTSSPARNSWRSGLQTAAGVPLQCDEPADFRTFRIGLFGLDKLRNIDRTVASLDAALASIRRSATPASQAA